MEAKDVGFKAFEKYERFYTNFQRPPMAPIYRPTSEEFSDPIAYVAKIKPEAEKYGVVKIVPPESFVPSFAIDRNTFSFTPRVQKLNEVEAICREKSCFLERITNYWDLQGIPFRSPILENRPVDLFKAHHLIRAEGGFDVVSSTKRWTAIAKSLGLKSNQAGSKLKDHYCKLVLPFLENVENKDLNANDEEVDDESEVDKKEIVSPRGLGEGRSSMQGGNRQGITSKSGRIMRKIREKKKEENLFDICVRCSGGDDEDRMITCDNCDRTFHMHCLKPSIKDRPKGRWNCTNCTEKEVRMMGSDFGFYDSSCSYSLEGFTDYANEFKRDYFNMEPEDVPIDLIEKTYWKKILDGEDIVSVKYGADLITNKVGSGFYRKIDEPSKISDKTMASHPWNLNNMPVLRDSVLTHFDSGISGMMVPWVYVGMCFSTFCWHTEDHWTYSVNYNHWGEPKIWYGIGCEEAEKFEEIVRTLCPSLFRLQPDLLHHMTIAVNPHFLRSRGVNVTTVHQNAGEFVITFPRAYHAGFNQGLNFAEAVNFAPIDWLKMGRQSMISYGLVRRCCVFAHDELVMKMIRACDKLSMSMAVAALDELKVISYRETNNRKMIASKGIKKGNRIDFESIPDDLRACRYCNTTLFMSALKCSHGNIVCLDHMDKICSKCPLNQIVLQYSYELEDLHPMLDKLKGITKKYDDWEKRVTAIQYIINIGKAKPCLSEVKNALEEARSKHYPSSKLFNFLIQTIDQINPTIEYARNILSDKIRVRSKTRIQRADTRIDMNELANIQMKLNLLPVHDVDLVDKVEGLISRMNKWENECKEVVDGPFNEEKLKRLIEESNSLDIRYDEHLIQLITHRYDVEMWGRNHVDPFLLWSPTKDMELANDFLTRQRSTLEECDMILNEGKRLGVDKCERYERLKEMKETAISDNDEAYMLMNGIDLKCSKVNGLWDKVRRSDWCSASGLDQLRSEIECLSTVYSFEISSEWTWLDMCAWIDKYDNSLCLRNSHNRSLLLDMLQRVEEFTNKLTNIFVPDHSYYSLYEIINFRGDVVALAAGQRPTLHRDRSDSLSVWAPTDNFKSRDDLTNHLDKMQSQQSSFLSRLQWTNDHLPVHKTCPCLKEKMDESILTCIVCRSKTHLSCGWWDPFLTRLPPGSFLCVRCLRSSRPSHEQVRQIVHTAPDKVIESTLVQYAYEHFEEVTKETRRLYIEWKKNDRNEDSSNRLKSIILILLSTEMVDSSLLACLTEPISVLFHCTLEEQRDAWDDLRMNGIPSKKPESLFLPCKRGRSLESFSPIKKRPRTITEENFDPCSHPHCLRPYSDSLLYVQCLSCKGWIHAICTGEVIEDPDNSNYICEGCMKKDEDKRNKKN